jgi:hypothetical protein
MWLKTGFGNDRIPDQPHDLLRRMTHRRRSPGMTCSRSSCSQRPSQRSGAERAVAGRNDECNRNLAAKRRRRIGPPRVKEIPRAGAVEDVPIDEARHEFEVNVLGPRLPQLVLPKMRENRSGRLLASFR